MASFWDAITGAFTGQPGIDASRQNQELLRQQLATGTGQVTSGYGTARGDITGGYGTALSALGQGYSGAVAPLGPAYDAAGNLISSGYAGARGDVTNAYNAQQGYLGGATGIYDPLQAKYGAATTTALGALGIGTPAQTAAARAAFTASPGYDWRVGQGIDALTRAGAVGGGGVGGNVLRQAQIFGQGLAGQDYQQWLSSLLGFTQPELTAAGGAAAGRAAQAGAAGQYGLTLANLGLGATQQQAALETERARMLSALASAYGGQQANLATSQAGQLAPLDVGQATTLANLGQQYAQNYGQQTTNAANAQFAAGGNTINALLGLAGAGVGLYGAMNPRPLFGAPTPSPTGVQLANAYGTPQQLFPGYTGQFA